MKNILITGANGQLGNEMQMLSEENSEYTYFFTEAGSDGFCENKRYKCDCELCSLYGGRQG